MGESCVPFAATHHRTQLCRCVEQRQVRYEGAHPTSKAFSNQAAAAQRMLKRATLRSTILRLSGLIYSISKKLREQQRRKSVAPFGGGYGSSAECSCRYGNVLSNTSG